MKGFSNYPSSFLIIYHFLPSLATFQTPEDSAHSNGKHEAVKVIKEYAEVCGSVVMKVYVLNLDAFLSHPQRISLCLVLITHFSFSLSLSHYINPLLYLCIEGFFFQWSFCLLITSFPLISLCFWCYLLLNSCRRISKSLRMIKVSLFCFASHCWRS